MKIFLLSLLVLSAISLNFNIWFALILGLLFIAIIFIKNINIKTKDILLFIAIFLVFFSRAYDAKTSNYSILKNTDQKNIVLKMIDPVKINGDYLKTYGYIDKEKVIIHYQVQSQKEKEFFEKDFLSGLVFADIKIGDIKERDNFFEVDYKTYYNDRQIYKQVTIEKINKIEENHSYLDQLTIFRTKLIKQITNHIKFQEAGYFEALIFGYKDNLFKEDKELFNQLGISHLLAISGLHIAGLVTMLNFILKQLGFTRETIDRLLIVILICYAILAGLSPSVLRASFMIILFILLKKYKVSNLSSLLLVFMILVFIKPYFIFDIGFQFSFLITFVLLLSNDFIKASKNKFLVSFKVSLLSSIVSIPISIFYFHKFTLISVLSNLVFVPLFTIIILPLLIFSYLIFLLSSSLFNLLCVPLLNFVFTINYQLELWFEKFAVYFKIGSIGQVELYILILLSFLLVIFINLKQYKKLWFSFIISTVVLVFISNNFTPKFETLTLANVEVKFIRDRAGRTYLVNTSHNYNDFYSDFRKKYVIYDIMNDYNHLFDYEAISQIDHLILTSDKNSDIGLAHHLIGQNKIKKLIILEKYANHTRYKDIIKLAKLMNIELVTLKESDDDITYYALKIKNSKEVFDIKLIN